MATEEPHIDPYLFQRQFEAFKTFVEEKSGIGFVSFASNPYTEKQEGYKYEIYRAGRDSLAFENWNQSDIGNGAIADAAINAIQIPNSNLVPWRPRFGKEARPHSPLFEAKNQKDQLIKVETCLFKLYRKEEDEDAFADLIHIFGRTYPLLAYFLFLKDRSRYLPIAPTFFDRAFAHLGAKFKSSRRCSWENYSIYVDLIRQVKLMLAESLGTEVNLLDAHSFTWMLAAQMEREKKLANVQEYLDLSMSERDAIAKARIGQGVFRESLIQYWSACAVTGCSEIALLRASHIKPWAQASLTERLNVYNGLLLSPAVDACFDAGYLSFDDEGKVLISEALSAGDAEVLGIHSELRLERIEPEHEKYLAFHRKHIFK